MGDRSSRRFVLAAFGLSAVVAVMGWTQPVAAQGLLAKAKAAGVLKIAIADNIPWSKLNPDGSLTGIAPMQVIAIAKMMGIPKVEAVIAPFGELVPGLLARRWDIVGESLTITPARCEHVLYSDPFYRSRLNGEWAAWLPGTVKGEKPKSYIEMAQQFPSIGILSGSNLPFMQKAVETTGNKATLVSFRDVPSMMEALETKRVAIVTVDRQTMHAQKELRHNIEITPVDSGQPLRGSGAAFRKEDADFRDAFVAAQRELKKSGEVKKILAQFNFDYDDEYMKISGDEACAL